MLGAWGTGHVGLAADVSTNASTEVPDECLSPRSDGKTEGRRNSIQSPTKASRLRMGQRYEKRSTSAARCSPLEDHMCAAAPRQPQNQPEALDDGGVEAVPETEIPAIDEAMWAATTKSKLKCAQALRNEADGQLRRTYMEHHCGTQRREQAYIRQRGHLQQKIDLTEELTRMLMGSKESILYAHRLLGASIFQLSKGHAATWPQLDVVERRLELREKRCPQERIQDHLQQALEGEQDRLHASQKQLVGRLNTSRDCLAELERLTGLVNEDIERKRHAARLDRALLRDPRYARVEENTLPPMLMVSQGDEQAPRPHSARAYSASVPSPAVRQSSKSTAAGADETCVQICQMNAWQSIAHHLCEKVHKHEATVGLVCQENKAILAEIRKACEAARQTTEAHMKKRLTEVRDLRRALEQEIRESDLTILNVEDGLTRSKRECERHRMALAGLERGVTARDGRIHGERIRDNVMFAQEGKRDIVSNTIKSLQLQIERKDTVLEQMTQSRNAMLEDLKQKVDTFTIDLACSRVCTRGVANLDTKQNISKPHHLRKGTTPTAKSATGNTACAPERYGDSYDQELDGGYEDVPQDIQE